MTLFHIGALIVVIGCAIYGWGFKMGWSNWDDWAFSMAMKSAGITVIVVGIALLITSWAQS